VARKRLAGGAQRELTEELTGDGQMGPPVHQNLRDKDQKKEGDMRNSLRGLDRRKVRRRRRSGRWRSSGLASSVRRCRGEEDWCGLERFSGGSFYRSRRGREGGARGGGRRHTGGNHEGSVELSVGIPYGRERKGKGWAAPVGCVAH
jgi:hypothetical protein